MSNRLQKVKILLFAVCTAFIITAFIFPILSSNLFKSFQQKVEVFILGFCFGCVCVLSFSLEHGPANYFCTSAHEAES